MGIVLAGPRGRLGKLSRRCFWLPAKNFFALSFTLFFSRLRSNAVRFPSFFGKKRESRTLSSSVIFSLSLSYFSPLFCPSFLNFLGAENKDTKSPFPNTTQSCFLLGTTWAKNARAELVSSCKGKKMLPSWTILSERLRKTFFIYSRASAENISWLWHSFFFFLLPMSSSSLSWRQHLG